MDDLNKKLDESKSGLTEEQWRRIREILTGVVGIKQVKLFGSRATGKYRVGSDVDLAVWVEPGSEAIFKLKSALEDSTLPYFFDVVDVGSLKEEDNILESIDRDGVEV